MKINLTKKQYRTLLTLLHLGSWMANAHRTDDIIKEFEELEQYILSFGRDFGMDEHIEYDERIKMYFLKQEYLESSGIERLIDEYNEDVFWEELINGLANRDMLERYSREALNKMSQDELLEKKFPFLSFYEEEFVENGLKNLRLLKGPETLQ